MTTVFVLKITQEGKFGYFDGYMSWDADVYSAKRYITYQLAEADLHLMFRNGMGGMVQIEKYFTP